MERYHVYFFKADGMVATRLDFLGAGDSEARRLALVLLEACADVCTEHELWCGTRLVIRDRIGKVPSMQDTLASARQQQILALEETLEKSLSRLNKSLRLCALIEASRT